MSSGRLTSLRDATPDAFGSDSGANGNGSGKKKIQLKFKPKAVARKSKEEREAAAAKIKKEAENANKLLQKGNDNKKKFGNKPNQQKKRVPRYLNNTHIVSSGPLAAGNFVGDAFTSRNNNTHLRRGFVKSEGNDSALVKKGLRTIENDANSSDEENDMLDNVKGDDDDEENKPMTSNLARFNMGREYKASDIKFDEDEIESEVELDEDELQAKRIEELFPVRPVRIRHESAEDAASRKKEEKDDLALQDLSSREATPELTGDNVQVKSETDQNDMMSMDTGKSDLQAQIEHLKLDAEFHSIDAEEEAAELKQLIIDHKKITNKIHKINDKTGKFMLFQLPYRLPSFIKISPKIEETRTSDQQTDDNSTDPSVKEEHGNIKNESNKKTATSTSAAHIQKKGHKTKKAKKKDETIPQDELTGKIGSLRVHKSGKVTMRIGNAIMDVGKGADTAFFQDIVALHADDEEQPVVEALGKIDGRVVVVPKF